MTVVWFRTPPVFSVSIAPKTDVFFCPIETYTQRTSVPFWLRIASSARVVLPTWRSPTINSRCPRPSGRRASMIFVPVNSGVSTGARSITPGAIRSTGRYSEGMIGRLSSSGLPRGSTTLPRKDIPTGMLSRFPVAIATSPPRMPISSPNRITSTCLRSRFSTIPSTPFGKVTNSSRCTMGSPLRVAMPLPTCCTVPTLRMNTWCFCRSLAD